MSDEKKLSKAAAPERSGAIEPLVTRLRFRAASADVQQQNITAALHREAADYIEALEAKASEDRQLRWALRARLDVALARLGEDGSDV